MPLAHEAIGDIAPKLAELTDSVLFGDIWQRSQLRACEKFERRREGDAGRPWQGALRENKGVW